MSFLLEEIIRENVKNLIPYSSARDEFKGNAKIFLDANENSLGSPIPKWYNRYPDPQQTKLKEAIAAFKGVKKENILLGNGSDECIDLLFRAFCEPGTDNVIICPPTYGMYEVSAGINNVAVKKIPLQQDFQPDIGAIAEAIEGNTKIIFLCSPNNPTGNSIDRHLIEVLLNNYYGLVVIDEAYINFSRFRSFIPELKEYPNLVVLQTFSKAWGLAAIRLGMCFAGQEIINVLNKIKPPYNISQPVQDIAMEAIQNIGQVNDMIREIVKERNALAKALTDIPVVEFVYPSEANFLLVKVTDANNIYNYLVQGGIIVRNRSNVELCEGCLRITVGTPGENRKLTEALKTYPS